MKGDFRKLEKLLGSLETIASNKARMQLSNNIGIASIELVHDSFAAAADPYGKAWAPLQGWRGGNPKPLQDTGRLKRSYRVTVVSLNGFEIGSDAIYAATHHFGATIRPKNGQFLVFRGVDYNTSVSKKTGKKRVSRVYGPLVFAKKVTIPPRPVMPNSGQGLPDEWAKEYKATAETWLRKCLR